MTASPIPNNTGQKTKILLITSVINKNNKFSFWRKNNKEVAEGMLVVAPNQSFTWIWVVIRCSNNNSLMSLTSSKDNSKLDLRRNFFPSC